MTRPTAPEHDDGISRPGLAVGLALGGPVMAFALWGIVSQSAATEPPELARWFVGGLVVHDALLVPLACAVGWALARAVPLPWRAPLRWGLFATAVTVLVGWAPLRGTGRARVPDNPSVQPLAYGTAVATVVAAVWLAVGIWLAVVAARRHRERHPRA